MTQPTRAPTISPEQRDYAGAAEPHPAPSAALADTPIGQRIDDSYAALSPQEQRAADFILDHLADLAVYNAAELARLSGVSKATVSRLFRRLGFSDAQEVRDHARALRSSGVPIGGITLAAALPSPVGTPPQTGGTPSPTGSGGEARDPAHAHGAIAASPGMLTLDAHLEQERTNLRRALHCVADGRVAAAASLLSAARRVVVIGLRNSYPVALHLRQQLVQGLDDVRLAPQPAQSIGEELAGLTSHDAVVLVGFRRRPHTFSAVMDAAQHLGAPIVLLADSSAARYAPRATIWLDCPVDSVTALDSYAAANSLVALLASETLAVAARTTRARIASINRLYADLDELE